jgi:hypothetical protein
MHLFLGLLVFGSLLEATLAQRPLNTTTNLTNVLTEPFFVKPTGISAKQMYVKQRDGGSSSFAGNSNNQEALGIRNKERLLPPPHQNSHLDIFVPPLNVVDGQQQDPPLPAQQGPAANNRLHKVQKQRVNKFSLIRQITTSLNNSSRGGFEGNNIGRAVSKPERLQTGLGGVRDPNSDPSDQISRPSSSGHSLTLIKDTIRNQENQHTPSPPPYNADDIDFNEKLGVKCSFEKPCAWTYDVNVTGPNFEVTTGVNLKESNVTGLL